MPTLQQGLQAAIAGAQGENPFVKAKSEEKLAKLKQYLQDKSDQQKVERDIESVRRIRGDKELYQPGESLKAGEISIGSDPTAHLMQANQRGEAAAIKQAQDLYSKAVPDLRKKMTAINEGLDAVNNPNDPGALGKARTAILSSMGMNRYNENEAKAILPPNMYSTASGLFNMGGDDSNPLSDVQKKATNSFFTGQLDNIRQQHSASKQSAINAAMSSPFATQMTSQRLANLGQPEEEYLGKIATKFSNTPQTKGLDLTGQVPQQTIGQKLMNYLKPQAPSSNTPMFDFDAEDRRRAASKVQQSAQQPQGQGQ